MKRIIHARVVTDDGVIPDGCVETEGGIIRSVGAFDGHGRAGDVDLKGDWLVPGFLDLHVHPETPESPAGMRDRVQSLSRDLLAVGTTGILWTLANMPLDKLSAMAVALRDVLADPPEPCVVMGIHFEGPYISPTSKGAFNPNVICTPGTLPPARLFDAAGDALKYLTLSPDLPGADEVVAECVRRGVRAGMCHSIADATTVQRCAEAGARSVVHTFNNTPDYPMKEGGVRGVTIDEVSMTLPDVMNEVICDGVHVDPVLVRLLARAKGWRNVMLVTDSVGGGRLLKEGEKLSPGGDMITVRGGVGRLDNGMLAGSTLTMLQAFRNYIAFTGCSVPDAVCAASSNAARFLGINRGRIAPGCNADLVALDAQLNARTL